MVNSPTDAIDSVQSPRLDVQHAFHLLPPTTTSPEPAAAVKGRRKRTSPRDHAILEAAYLRNSKPDKTERALIVSSVELGEKEVQIWFQNRRQNDRRKSKPLQPHELVAHLHTHSAIPIPHQMTSSSPREDSSAQPSRLIQTLAPAEVPNRPVSRASSIRDLLNPSSSPETLTIQGASHLSSQATLAPSTPPSSLEELAKMFKSENTGHESGDTKHNESSSEQGSARKRDHDEMTGKSDKANDGVIQKVAEMPPRVKEPLARTSSMVRLAMTVDGAVKIRTNDEPTPSPEKPRAAPPQPSSGKARAGFARSKSALSDVETFRHSGQGRSRQVGAGFGRSRDARTWEFYCDSTAKDALWIQAEAETAGSAVSAINLVRSNSFKTRVQGLSPAVSKNGARVATNSKTGKPKLSRAKSSLGRLQGFDGAAEHSGRGLKTNHARSPSGDSDKENWAPGTRASVNPLRRTQASVNERPILQDNEGVIFRDATPSVPRSRQHGKVGATSQQSPSKEKAKGEELDCVQGLLSLSQGAWR